MSTVPEPSPALAAAIAEFGEPRGYLAAATNGLPPQRALVAMQADLQAWSAARRDLARYEGVVERSRAAYASLVSVPAQRVAVGSQTSVLVALAAAAVPGGAEVVLAEGDFSSVHFPFVQRAERGEIRVRVVPVEQLAAAVGPESWLVAFSLVQSATGVLADGAAIAAAAAAHGTLTLCDTTQAVGVLPVEASRYDITVCHAYKWLCCPRGVAFLTITEAAQALVPPAQAGWYAGEAVWESIYGPQMQLARDARRYDVSPAWEAWVGAEQSLALFASLDIGEVWARAVGLGDALCAGLGMQPQHQAIVTWPDPEGRDLAALEAAGIRASGRAGRARVAFHLWNDESDVEAALQALSAQSPRGAAAAHPGR